MSRNKYINKRNKYQPENIKAIFVFESPPESGKYFYDAEGKATEPLFVAMMELIGYESADKASGLAEFVRRGLIIVDATYIPVDQYVSWKRDKVIKNSLPTLLEDLETLTPDKKTPIILVKVNICRLLADPLKSNGFNVINNGVEIPFPSTGQQGKFRTQIALVLNNAGLNLEA